MIQLIKSGSRISLVDVIREYKGEGVIANIDTDRIMGIATSEWVGGTISRKSIGHDKTRLNLVKTIVPNFSTEVRNEFGFSDSFWNLLGLICRKGNYLCLSEPELDLSLNEQVLLIRAISSVENTYKKIYIQSDFPLWNIFIWGYKGA